MELRPGFVFSRLNSPHAQGVWVAALPLALGALWAGQPHAVFLRVSVTPVSAAPYSSHFYTVFSYDFPVPSEPSTIVEVSNPSPVGLSLLKAETHFDMPWGESMLFLMDG